VKRGLSRERESEGARHNDSCDSSDQSIISFCFASRLLNRQQHKGKGSPYSITERRVLELIPVLGSQPAGDVSHEPSCRLPFLSARPAVTLATINRAATNFTAW